MICGGCGYTLATGVRIGRDNDGTRWEICDHCSNIKFHGLPDVYLGSKGGIQTDENLCGKDGKPIPFSTKREKAAIMKHLGVRQADSAEKYHGSRNNSHLNLGKKFI